MLDDIDNTDDESWYRDESIMLDGDELDDRDDNDDVTLVGPILLGEDVSRPPCAMVLASCTLAAPWLVRIDDDDDIDDDAIQWW